MKIKQVLQEYIPNAYYSNGVEVTDLMYKICDMFDINSQSFKQVKEKKNTESNFKESDYTFIDRFLKEKSKLDQN